MVAIHILEFLYKGVIPFNKLQRDTIQFNHNFY